VENALSTLGTLSKSIEAHQSKLGQLKKDLKALKVTKCDGLGKGRELPLVRTFRHAMMDRGAVVLQLLKGKSHVKTSEIVTNRRSRSKFRVCIVGSSLIAWVQVLEDWGMSVEGVMEHILDPIKDIRQILSKLPTITLQEALSLEPLGPWDGCMFANIRTSQDLKLFAMLFGCWHPAIAVISMDYTLLKADTISLMPLDVLPSCKKRLITVAHTAIGGVTSTSCRFEYYTRWPDTISHPLLMTRDVLPWMLQMALLDMFGASQGAAFEPQASMTPPEAVGVLSSSSGDHPSPVLRRLVGTRSVFHTIQGCPDLGTGSLRLL
jgi:hypothetical protein